MRSKLKKQKIIAEILIALGFISVIVFSILFIKQPLFYIGIIVGLLMMVVGRTMFNKLKDTINEKLIPEVYKAKLGKSIHRPLEGFNSGDIYQTNLFLHQDRFFSNDLVSGEVFGFKYKMSEVQFLDAKRDFKKFSSDVLFQGLFIEINVESKIKGSVYIVPKATKLHKYLDKDNQISLSEPLASEFDVYSKNKKEATQLLNSEFGTLLQSVDDLFPNIYIAVKKHAIYIGIDSRKKPLDVKLFRRLDMSYLDVLSNEIITIKEIVYTLYKK
ncbi:MAG: DUF3137 domain-containing protein [Acholeplasmataceae bacterium]